MRKQAPLKRIKFLLKKAGLVIHLSMSGSLLAA
jgi:hypothetical protein